MKAQKGNGKVHNVRPSRFAGTLILECSGRAVSGALPVGDETEVTCEACKKSA